MKVIAGEDIKALDAIELHDNGDHHLAFAHHPIRKTLRDALRGLTPDECAYLAGFMSSKTAYPYYGGKAALYNQGQKDAKA